MAPRFDYIGFANGGNEVGNGSSKYNRAAIGSLELGARMAAVPIYAMHDVANKTVNAVANGANWLLGKATGYEVPYEAALPTNKTAENNREMNTLIGEGAQALGLRQVPAKPARARVTAPATSPVDPSKSKPAQDLGIGNITGRPYPDTHPESPTSSEYAIPTNPSAALTPVGYFQAEGGRRREFSADASGNWYEGGKPMRGFGGRGPVGNGAVDEIVSRLLSQQPQAHTGPDRRALPGGMTLDEFLASPQAAGKDRGALMQFYYQAMQPSETQRFSAIEGADYNRGMLGNATAKTQLEAIMTPIEMEQRGALADYYKAHASQMRTMSDPNFLLRMKGKDAETEALKSNNEILKTILPKAYESADAQTKAYLEANPTADRNAIWNNAFNNSLSAFIDEFFKGKRYAPGVQMPGKSSWFGYNAPEVNIPGGWVDPAMNNLYSVTAQALQAAGDDGLKRTKIMNRFNEMVRELRGRSQGISTQ